MPHGVKFSNYIYAILMSGVCSVLKYLRMVRLQPKRRLASKSISCWILKDGEGVLLCDGAAKSHLKPGKVHSLC